jgi:hypothetical protein
MMRQAAILIGGAQFVFKEYEQAKQLCMQVGVGWSTFVANDICTIFPDDIDHACMIHTDSVNPWIEKRLEKGYSAPNQVWSHRFSEKRNQGIAKYVTHVNECWRGSVGLFMVQVAQRLDFQACLLCGVPMSPEQLHIIRKIRWTQAIGFQNGWIVHKKQIAPIVRSFSGWTMQEFGFPDASWLHSRLS